MPKISKNTILKYIPQKITVEKQINPLRIHDFNQKPLLKGDVVYICERELRAKDNFALQFAVRKAEELNAHLKIIHPKITHENKNKEEFINRQLAFAKNMFLKLNLDFEIEEEKSFFNRLENPGAGMIIIDFNPILERKNLENLPCKIYEIDGHNIVPARFVSDKQEYGAMTLRRKIYYNINPFMTEFENAINEEVEADSVLKDFIENKLQNYEVHKNNPDKNVTSELSKYLNLGFISSQRIALEVIKSTASDNNKEAFLEELIIRKELADNFCLYCTDFKTLNCIPNWAKISLKNHRHDIRAYKYTLQEFETAQTHDKLWNSTQKQLLTEGTVHGYLRMYWAKKITEWSESPNTALKTAIYLNDKYAYDAPSANGYTAILWAISGLHDRAFQDWHITGKIRRMTFNSIKHKFKIDDYISKYK